MEETYKSPLKQPEPKLIYALRVDKLHPGYLKIGDTKLEEGFGDALTANSPELKAAAKKRIKQYSNELSLEFDIDYAELTLYIKGGMVKSFRDYDVHAVLERSGYPRVKFDEAQTKGAEWFKVDVDTVRAAIQAVKEGKQSIQGNESSVAAKQKPIEFRPEQIMAIQQTLSVFNKKSDKHEMLWDAKMRFGKTLTALQVVREMGFKRTLILTHRPVVDEGWFTDFSKIFFDTQDYRYGSRNHGDDYRSLEDFIGGGLFANPNGHYIYFSSIQYLRNKELKGDVDEKNAILNTKWDCLIIDEAHEGTQTDLGQILLEKLKKENTYVLNLSGTPFNIKEQFSEEQVFTWDYIMEQKAKTNWEIEHFGAPNPYADLPKMKIFTFDLGDLLNLNYVINEQTLEDQAFSFSEFFRVWTGDLEKDHRVLPSLNHRGRFIHEKDVRNFLTLITTPDEGNHYPYATDEYRDFFRHTLWMVPGVASAKALSALIQEVPAFKDFRVVNVAGEGDDDDSNEESLQKLRKAIGPDPEQTHTITLSCGRLTTGVTVREWTGVFMLSGSKNTDAKAYMQTIFRVQSPYHTPDGRVKEECYVFDFAPDRTLNVISQTAHINTKNTDDNQRNYLGQFLNFCPVIGFSGTCMQPFDTNNMLEKLKSIQIDHVVRRGFEDSHLYNDNLLDIDDTAIALLEHLKEGFGGTQRSKGDDSLTMSDSGMGDKKKDKNKDKDNKTKKTLTPEEREKKRKQQNRRSAINILHGISIRIPLIVYGAELDKDEDLLPSNLTAKVDNKSWEEFMPKGVTKRDFEAISRFYDEDVFRAAGRRIRDLAAAADRLEPTERVKKIAQIFSYFHNPDKETVLTPWRVVNMHMSDTLGGYDFFDESHVDEGLLEHPRFVEQGDVTTKVFNSKTRILEINSKTGLYPLYVAYSTYRNRLYELEQNNLFGPKKLTDEEKIALWNQTVDENIYVVCRTKMAVGITRRTLGALRFDAPHHIACYKNLIEILRENPNEFINRVNSLKLFYEYNKNIMIKFNAVVGNPPYQLSDKGAGATDAAAPIYQLFVNSAFNLKPDYVSIIMPSKWMVGGRQELNSFLKEMQDNKGLVMVKDFENDRLIFPSAHNDGGICYFLWDGKKNTEGVEYTFIKRDGSISTSNTLQNSFGRFVLRDSTIIPILQKIGKYKEISFSSIVSKTRPFGLRKDLFNSPERYPEANPQELPYEGSVKIYGVKGKKGGAKRINAYINRIILSDKYKAIDKHKIFFTTSYSSDAVIPPEEIKAYPNEACTETFLLIGPFDSKKEMDACSKYIHTYLFRFLLKYGHGTMQVNSGVFLYIPLIDFSENSPIDWDASIESVNQQLYTRYEFTPDEQKYIESLINPM